MTIVIRPLQQSDETKFRQSWSLYNEFYKRTIPEEVTALTFARCLNPDVEMYCAVAEDESRGVIGFTTWFPHLSTSSTKRVVYLNDLFVDSDVRVSGAGGKLIEHVYKWCKENDIASCYWHTQHFNHAAQLLYVKKAPKTDFVVYRKTF